MSQALNQWKGRLPPPEPVKIAPYFTGTGLPQSPEDTAANLRLQQRDERRARSQAALYAAGKYEAPPTELCQTALHLSLFFDGTNNNEPADKRFEPRCTSNVARLYHATIDHQSMAEAGALLDTPTYFRYYCPGVGTVFPEIGEHYPDADGLKFAAGGENRINWGLTRLLDALGLALTRAEFPLHKTRELVEQMSSTWLIGNGRANREEAMRPEMEQLEQLLTKRKQTAQKPEILALRLYVYGFSRGAAEARTFCNWLRELVECADGYRFAGLPISIEFLGLFDTVAAVGLADSVPFAAGHMGWADGTMRLPDGDTRLPDDPRFLQRCVHLVSAHEQRASFPLDSIRRCERLADGSIERDGQSRYRRGTEEFVYPGMHSDVGGGYPPGDQGKAMDKQGLLMSQVPLHHMYREAFKAGAPLQVPQEALGAHEAWRTMSEESRAEFAMEDPLVARFNAWQAQTSSAPLETVVEREIELITGWRIDRYHGGVDKTGFYNRTARDESEAVWKARERLHQHKHDELQQNNIRTCEQGLTGEPLQAGQVDCAGYSARLSLNSNPLSSHSFDQDLQTIGGLEEYRKIKIEKLYEPTLDRRQLEGAAKDFSRDYRGEWGPVPDEGIVSGLFTTLSGVVYLINEEDEAKEYEAICTNGERRNRELFAERGQVTRGQENLVALFDDHVHDSRAWFMNSSGAGPREPWTDYFRYRLVHFDHESNKSMTPLLATGRVIGLAIAVGSVGLTVKRRDPRYLLGLMLPTLSVPVIRGKLPMPESQSLPTVSAFDPLTGIAYPMMAGIEHLRAYTREPGSVLRLVEAMPLPQPLTEATANTPELKAIFQAAQVAMAGSAASEGKPMGLNDRVAGQLSDAEQPDKAKSPDRLSLAGDVVGKYLGMV